MDLRALPVILAFAALSAAASAETHFVASVGYEVEGSTSKAALRSATALREGLEFPSEAELSAFLERERQDLVNRRVFSVVRVEDEEGAPEAGRVPHAVTVAVKDSFTFFPLPYPGYDSNLGFQLGVETHYDNAFGTLTDWYLDTYVVLRTRDGEYGIGPWMIHPKASRIRLLGMDWTVELKQERQESALWDKGAKLAEWDDHHSSLNVSTRLPIGGGWRVSPNANFDARYGYETRLGEGLYDKDLMSAGLGFDLSRGGADWVGNFRKGSSATLSASAKALDKDGDWRIAGSATANGCWYLPFLGMNWYGRLSLPVAINDVNGSLGSYLRGVLDNRMGGTVGLFMNQSLAFSMIRWKGVFDLQVHPFVDAGLALPSGRDFDAASDIRAGLGADVVLFVDAVSNLCIRCTAGVDPSSPDPLGELELILVTALSY